MIKTKFTTAAVLALAIAACQQPAEDNIAIDEVNNLAAADMEVLPPSDEAGAPANGADDEGSFTYTRC